MAQRYWTVHEDMGYAGTDSEEDVDALEWLGVTEKELEAMSDGEVEEELAKMAWDSAIEKVDAWAEPTEAEE